MSLADIAFDRKLDLIRWMKTTQGKAYLGSQSTQQDFEEQTMERAMENLDRAVTYSVSSEICQVLETAAHKLQETPDALEGFTFEVDDMPEPHGFVYFERPIVFSDSRGKSMVVTSIQWYGCWLKGKDEEITSFTKGERRGIGINLFTDIRDPRDHLFTTFEEDQRLWGHRLIMVSGSLPAFGGIGVFGTVPQSDVAVFLLSFLRFIREPWLDAQRTRLSRSAMKRGLRADVDISDTLVVRLRKRPPSEGREDSEASHVEWSHQWIVGAGTGGFWRRQWYPSENRHKPKFIHPYLKGPSDKPLVVKDVKFVVNR